MELRLPSNVKLMAVTKGRSMEEILPVLEKYDAPIIGESRWQDAREKVDHFPEGVEKHFIGHLQTNKVKYIVPNFDCIQSVDSLKLAEAISSKAVRLGMVMDIYLQVNVSDDANKYGLKVSELGSAIESVKDLPGVKLVGLMTITAKQSEDETRRDFQAMKELQKKYDLTELSMGMSSDWKIAVEEGATVVRVGTALFDL